ncbi:unnamed protein product, partial [marine sediment metagenome]
RYVWLERFERIRKHAIATDQAEFADFVEKSIKAYEQQQ